MLEADERLAARKHAGALLLLALFSCSRGTRETVLATDLISPRNLQVDGTHAYWLDGADGGVLLSVPVDGSARPTVLSSSSSFVDLDVDDSSIYWSDDAGLHVLDKVNLDAGPRDVLAWSSTDAGVPTRQFAVTSKGVVFLAWEFLFGGTPNTHPQANRYFLQMVPRSGLPDGGSPTLLASMEESTVLGTGGFHPSDLVADESNAYWSSASAYAGQVYRAPLDSGDAGLFTRQLGSSLVLANGQLYGLTNGTTSTTIASVPLSAASADAATVVATNRGSFSNFAVDGTGVYSTHVDLDVQDIEVTNLADGGTRVVVPGEGSTWIAVDRNYVYWLTSDSLLRTPK